MSNSQLKLSQRVLTLKPSASLGMAQKAREMKAKGIKVLTMTTGEPDFDTPKPVIDFVKATLDDKEQSSNIFKYTPVKGLDVLTESMLIKFKRDQKIDYSSDEVMASVGGKAALSFALDCMVGEGDEVIIFSPYWVSYPAQVHLAGAKAVYVESSAETDFVPKIEDLKAAITPNTKAIMMNTPNNPSGAVFDEKFLVEMMDLLRDTQIWVISDEIYEELIFENDEDIRHVSPASLSDDARARTLVISGVAKSYAMTGWRIGVAAGPKELIKAMCKIQGQRYTCAAGITQIAAAYALREPEELKPYLADMKKAYAERRLAMLDFVSKSENLSVFNPKGAFYGLLDVSKICQKYGIDDLEFANKLLEEKHVAVVPGSPFGAPGTVRISLASAMGDILEGLRRIEAL